MTKFFITILYLIPFICVSQITQDTLYEKEMDLVKHYLRKDKLDSIMFQAQKMFDNYDINCEQKGRIYQKVGLCHYYAGKDEEAVRFLKDSTILVWQKCEGIDDFHFFSATRILIETLSQNKRLKETKEWIQFLESNPSYLENQNLSSLFKYYNLAGKIYSNSDDFFTAERYFQKAYSTLQLNKKWIHKYSFSYYNEYAGHLNEYGLYDKSIDFFNKANNHYYKKYDKFIYYCNILSPLIASKRLEEANIISDSLKKELVTIDDLGYSSYALKQITKLEIAKKNFDDAKKVMLKLDSINNANEFNISSNAYSEDLKASLSFKEGDYEASIAHTNNAINLLVNYENEETKIEISNKELNYDNATIINAESLKLILKNAFEITYEQYKKKQNSDNIKTLINIASGISTLYTKNRKSYSSEVSSLTQLSKTYDFYGRVMDIVSDYYQKTKDESILEKLIWLSLNNKNDILTSLLNTKNIYKKNLTSTSFNKLTELENSKRKIELNIIKSKKQKTSEINDSLSLVYINTKQKIEELKKKEKRNNPTLIKELLESENSFKKFNIKDALTKNSALIDIFYGKNYIYISAITKNNLHLNKIAKEKNIESTLIKLIDNIQNYGNLSEYKKSSLSIYTSVLKETFKFLERDNIENICVLNDGFLHEIPFESYWRGNSYLVEDYNFIYLTNIAKLKSLKSQKINSTLGFATTYSKKLNQNINTALNTQNISLSSLNSSLSEITVTEEAFPGSVFLNEKANISNFKNQLNSNNDILHLALHGLLINENTSALIFDDNNKDFILKSSEVYKMDIKSRLTILSACYSGKGEIFSGEGIRNLARAFLYAGSENIIPSMWSASDISNKEIVEDFVTQLKESKNIALSLTKAKRNYLINVSPAYSHPSYWSNMIFMGSPQSQSNIGFGNKLFLLILVPIGLIILFFLKKK